jgi:hypothetical protein
MHFQYTPIIISVLIIINYTNGNISNTLFCDMNTRINDAIRHHVMHILKYHVIFHSKNRDG